MARPRAVKVCEAIARAVVLEIGDTPIFALIGDANLPVVGSLGRDAKANLCFARDEGAAVAMADGHAQANGALGAASVTSGPGLTHAATSLLAASRMRTPLVVIAGDTPTHRPVGLQAMMDIDQRRFAEACEVLFQDLRNPASLADDIRSAFHRARTERRPVLLNAPLDVQMTELPGAWAYEPSHQGMTQRHPLESSPAALQAMLEIIESSTRPIILAGRGALWSGARAELERLGDTIGALLGTTLLAKGLFGTKPWTLGGIGGFNSPARIELIREADAIFAFGAELGHFTTQGGSLFEGRQVVRIDTGPFRGDLPDRSVLAVQADARTTAAALCTALASKPPRIGFRSAETEARLAAPLLGDVPPPSDGLIDPRKLMLALGGAIPEDARIVVGGGHFWSFPCLYLSPPTGGAFLCPLGAAAVGQALPFAIGVAMSKPRRPVVAVEGDGSLMMNIQELNTAARHRLPLALVIMNDGALTAEALKLRVLGYDPNLAVYTTPEFEAIAKAFGWKAATIRSDAEIAGLVRDHRWNDGPLLIDARISREIIVDPVAVKDLSRRR